MNSATTALQKTVKLLEATAGREMKWRPLFHLSPKTGWMNDPNGLCQVDGIYHIFYQYSPFDVKPGLNYWGHYTTVDFVNYNYHTPSLCSDEKFDCHGVYSGSALSENGKIHLFYTGNVKLPGDYDYVTEGREHNTITAVSDDGYTFDKKHMLMSNSDYPKDVTCHVRDPKVWNEGGVYYMVLGARRKDDVGEVLLYISKDMECWRLENRITTQERLGYMWECPDVYRLNGKTFLSISPQGVEAQGYKYNNIYQSGYMEIRGDIQSQYSLEKFEEYDHGFDFYAPQTFEDESGRRILIAWLGLPDIDEYYRNPCSKYGWQHMLTIPRILEEENGKIIQIPVKELEQLRDDFEEQIIQNNGIFEKRRIFELYADTHKCRNFEIIVRKGCFIKFENGLISLSFNEIGHGRTVRAYETKNVDNIRIFCDSSSVEIFANNGKIVFSSRFYPEDDMTGVEILAKMSTSRICYE